MSRFIAVKHYWFIKSKGFSTEYLHASNIEEARKEAALIEHYEGELGNIAVAVIEISDKDIHVNRRLTWKERILGKIIER